MTIIAETACTLSRYDTIPITMTATEWISVLKLSTMWRFGKLRREAIEELTKLEHNPVKKILLGREYRVERWLIEGYKELVEREAALTETEKTDLGDAATIKIYEGREATFRTGSGVQDWGFNGCRDLAAVESLVRAGFVQELYDVRYDGDAVEEDAKSAEDKVKPKKKKHRKPAVRFGASSTWGLDDQW